MAKPKKPKSIEQRLSDLTLKIAQENGWVRSYAADTASPFLTTKQKARSGKAMIKRHQKLSALMEELNELMAEYKEQWDICPQCGGTHL
jgi:hypothetical protein